MHIVHFLQSFSKLDVILKLKIVKFGDRRTNRPTIVVMKLLPQLKIDISLFFCDFFLFFWEKSCAQQVETLRHTNVNF